MYFEYFVYLVQFVDRSYRCDENDPPNIRKIPYRANFDDVNDLAKRDAAAFFLFEAASNL